MRKKAAYQNEIAHHVERGKFSMISHIFLFASYPLSHPSQMIDGLLIAVRVWQCSMYIFMKAAPYLCKCTVYACTHKINKKWPGKQWAYLKFGCFSKPISLSFL
jgi:hypothetical protein